VTDHVAETAGLDPPAAHQLPRRHVVAVALGNALEFHGFITCAARAKTAIEAADCIRRTLGLAFRGAVALLGESKR
jgi:hypothetical protein